MMSDMQRDFVEAIKSFRLRSYQKGEPILVSGAVAENLYAIRSGFAKVTSYSSKGSEQLVWIASRYDILPTESLFLRKGVMHFDYTAMTDVEAYEIPKQNFLDMCEENTLLLREVARSMSSHYDDLLLRLRSVEQPSIRDKLIHTLHYIATRFSGEPTVSLTALGLQLSHQEIARMIGATRETTAIELKRLKDAGLISYTRTEFIIFTDKLEPLL